MFALSSYRYVNASTHYGLQRKKSLRIHFTLSTTVQLQYLNYCSLAISGLNWNLCERIIRLFNNAITVMNTDSYVVEEHTP